MSISVKFSLGDIYAKVDKQTDANINMLVDRMLYIGEQCVNTARESGSYNNITGNLRSSIGYIVLHDGEVVKRSSSQAYSGTKGDGSEGVSASKTFLDELIMEDHTGITLIVVAGMKYAIFVEAIHNKDVLTSAKLIAENLLKQLEIVQ